MGWGSRRFKVGGPAGASGWGVTGAYDGLENEPTIDWSGNVAPERSSAGGAQVSWSGNVAPAKGPGGEPSFVFDEDLV